MRLGFGARMLVSAATVGVCGVVLSFGHASAGHVAAHRVHRVEHVQVVRPVSNVPPVTPCTTCKPAKASKTRLRLHRPYGLHRVLRRPWWMRRRWRRRWNPLWWLGL